MLLSTHYLSKFWIVFLSLWFRSWTWILFSLFSLILKMLLSQETLQVWQYYQGIFLFLIVKLLLVLLPDPKVAYVVFFLLLRSRTSVMYNYSLNQLFLPTIFLLLCCGQHHCLQSSRGGLCFQTLLLADFSRVNRWCLTFFFTFHFLTALICSELSWFWSASTWSRSFLFPYCFISSDPLSPGGKITLIFTHFISLFFLFLQSLLYFDFLLQLKSL